MPDINLEVIDPDKIEKEKKKKLEENLGLVSGKARENELRIIAKKDGEPVGYMEVVPDKSKRSMVIQQAKVDKEKRGKGIGTKMNEKTMEIASKLGIEKIYGVSLENKKTKRFWKNKGYKVEESGWIEKKKPTQKRPASLKISDILEKEKKRNKSKKGRKH